MKLISLNKRVIAQDSVTKESETELYIPDSAKFGAPVEAVVTSVGKLVEDVKVGDHIVYDQSLAKKVPLEGKEYLIINEEDILAKVEE